MMGNHSKEKEPLEKQILESKRKFQSIIDGITDGIVLIDSKYKIIAINKFMQQKINKSFPEIESKHCYRMLNCPSYGSDDCPAKKTFKTSGASNVIHESLDKEGNEVYLDIHTFPLKDENDDITQVVVHIRDISERKRLEKEAIRIEKLTSTAEIAAGVAHEVRNPLSIVSGSAQYLQKALGPSHAYREYTETIIKNVQTVEIIISELLNFARPLPMSLELKDVHECLNKTLRFLEKKCFEQKIQLIKEYGRKLPLVMLDEQHIGQVFLNLALNALQAMPQGGKLTIHTQQRCPEKKRVMVKFKDTGPGIPPENMVKIFAPFFSTRPTGIGLGLSMSQRIVEMHGGFLTAESTMGQGATFIITLPCHES